MIRQIGVDIGNGYTKAVSSTRDASFQSVVAPAQAIAYSAQERDASLIEIKLDSQEYFVGELALRQSSFAVQDVGRQRLSSRAYAHLFATAMALVMPQSCDVEVVCGLPVAWYEAERARVSERLRGTWETQRAGLSRATFHVLSVRVVPEPLGTLLSLALAADGTVADASLMRQTVGILDVGTKTSDFAVFGPGLEYRQDWGGSIESGLSLILGRIIAHASNTWGMELSLAEADRCLQERAVTVRGERHDLSKVIATGRRALAERVLARMGQLWDGGLKIDRILLSGGGAESLAPYIISVYPHAQVVSAPFMANANGFYRWGIRLSSGG